MRATDERPYPSVLALRILTLAHAGAFLFKTTRWSGVRRRRPYRLRQVDRALRGSSPSCVSFRPFRDPCSQSRAPSMLSTCYYAPRDRSRAGRKRSSPARTPTHDPARGGRRPRAVSSASVPDARVSVELVSVLPLQTGRRAFPDELGPLGGLRRRRRRALRGTVPSSKTPRADDVLNSLRAEGSGRPTGVTLLMTGDRDMLPMRERSTNVLLMSRKQAVTDGTAEVRSDTGSRQAWSHLIALRVEPVDGSPGFQ